MGVLLDRDVRSYIVYLLFALLTGASECKESGKILPSYPFTPCLLVEESTMAAWFQVHQDHLATTTVRW